MATRREIEQEIAAAFSGLKVMDKEIHEHKWLFNDVVSVGEFLSQSAGVKKGLIDLEKDMMTILAGRIEKDGNNNSDVTKTAVTHFSERKKQFDTFAENEYLKPLDKTKVLPEQATAYPSKNDERFGKLLTTALKKVEKDAGFIDAVDYIWSGLDDTAFLSIIKARRPFKDYGASPLHGAYTHRIQWYLLASQLFRTNAANVYAAIADWATKDGKDRTYQIEGRGVLWNHLCDRADNTGFKNVRHGDFRSPNYLLSHILENKEDTPILTAFLDTRRAKRPALNLYQINNNPNRMAALKLFRKSYDRLTPDERKRADELAAKGVITVDDLLALVKS